MPACGQASRQRPALSLSSRQNCSMSRTGPSRTYGGQTVQVLRMGNWLDKQIQTGLANDTNTEVTAGLSDGYQVAIATTATRPAGFHGWWSVQWCGLAVEMAAALLCRPCRGGSSALLCEEHKPVVAPDVTIKIVGLRSCYHMGDVEVHALRGIDLEVKRGDWCPSWDRPAPEVTMMNIIGCLDTPPPVSII